MSIKDNRMLIIIITKIVKSKFYSIDFKGINYKTSTDSKPFIGGFWGGRYTCFNGFNSVKALKVFKVLKNYKDSFTSQKSHA